MKIAYKNTRLDEAREWMGVGSVAARPAALRSQVNVPVPERPSALRSLFMVMTVFSATFVAALVLFSLI